MAVQGHGLLITGDPGVGKSELALGLLDRGHQLVADDAPLLEVRTGRLIGQPPPGFIGLLHIQGIGLLDIRRTHGDPGVCPEIALGLILHLDRKAAPLADEELLRGRWDRLAFAGISLPRMTLPSPGERNLPLLVETLVRHYFLCPNQWE
ncbi:MAG: hypothetical protein A2286_07745 [Gammaproteobacteria bacterium RIFOXYA12_FULL_61_12]|nr:MAG: hypothetical protein A2286_07745 [Gammaproteobacteria bacterium RIFOXYA12_FULL_61_12]